MASSSRRHPRNAAGPWFVDSSCIDCDASSQCAPDLFGHVDGQSVIERQPVTDDEIAAATRALALCPTGSIGVEGGAPPLDGVFPYEIENRVHLAGYNSTASFGANAFFVARPHDEGGGILVDSPRWVPALVKRFEALGGIRDVLITHKDDVAHAEQYAKHFGARVVVHEDDRHAAPFATEVIRGRDPVPIRDRLLAIPVPGHTRGSVCYLLEDRYLFTGDSLFWSRTLRDLCAFKRQCWYSWPEQARSLERLADHDFEWVLAGHGDRWSAPAAWLKDALRRLAQRMKSGDPALDGVVW